MSPMRDQRNQPEKIMETPPDREHGQERATPCSNTPALQPAEAACVSIFDGPFTRAGKRRMRKKLQDPVDCTDVVGALRHILFAAVLNAEEHRRLSIRWSRLHYLLGLPAAIATSVGAIGLASDGAIGNMAA